MQKENHIRNYKSFSPKMELKRPKNDGCWRGGGFKLCMTSGLFAG